MSIYVYFSLPEHWANWGSKIFFVLEKKIPRTKHKYYSLQLSFWGITHLFRFELRSGLEHRDHWGPAICIGLLGLELNAEIYDSRHWDMKGL